MSPLFCQTIQVGRFQPFRRLLHKPHQIVAMVVAKDENDIPDFRATAKACGKA